MENERETVLLMGSGNPELAKKVGTCLDMKVHQTISRFSDNEARIDIPVNVRGRDVFIIQSTTPPFVDNHYAELMGIIAAAKKSAAARITAVIPYFGYSRQDRIDGRRTAIMASVWARVFELTGADQLISIDLHSEPSEGAVGIAWDNLSARKSLLQAIRLAGMTDYTVVSPDQGGVRRAVQFSEESGRGKLIPVIYKWRDPEKPDESEVTMMSGDIKGQKALLFDDLLSTGGTLANDADFLMDNGALSVDAAVTHGVFSGDALKRISDSAIDRLFITDTIRAREEVIAHPKIAVVSVAPLIARAIDACMNNGTLWDLK